MVTQELITFIRTQKTQGISDEKITNALMTHNWNAMDISSAFNQIQPTSSPQDTATNEYLKASVTRRFLGLILDIIIISILNSVIIFVASRFTSSTYSTYISIISYIISVSYLVFFTITFGATIGKLLTQIRVVSIGYEKPTLSQIIIRESIGKLLSTIPLGLGFLWAIRSPNKQTWHDALAKTYVIRLSKGKPVPQSQAAYFNDVHLVWIIIILLCSPMIIGIISGITSSQTP